MTSTAGEFRVSWVETAGLFGLSAADRPRMVVHASALILADVAEVASVTVLAQPGRTDAGWVEYSGTPSPQALAELFAPAIERGWLERDPQVTSRACTSDGWFSADLTLQVGPQRRSSRIHSEWCGLAGDDAEALTSFMRDIVALSGAPEGVLSELYSSSPA